MEKQWLNYNTTPEEVADMNGVLSREAYRRFKQLNRRDMAVVLARLTTLQWWTELSRPERRPRRLRRSTGTTSWTRSGR